MRDIIKCSFYVKEYPKCVITSLERLLNLTSELMDCSLCGRTFSECKLSLTKGLVDTEIMLKVP